MKHLLLIAALNVLGSFAFAQSTITCEARTHLNEKIVLEVRNANETYPTVVVRAEGKPDTTINVVRTTKANYAGHFVRFVQPGVISLVQVTDYDSVPTSAWTVASLRLPEVGISFNEKSSQVTCDNQQ